MQRFLQETSKESCFTGLREEYDRFSKRTPQKAIFDILEHSESRMAKGMSEPSLHAVITRHKEPVLDALGTIGNAAPRQRTQSLQSQTELQPQPASAQLETLRQHNQTTNATPSTENNGIREALAPNGLHDHESPKISVAEVHPEIPLNEGMSKDRQSRIFPIELVHIQERLVQQLIVDYISNWRSSNGSVRSRPGQQSTSTSRQKRRRAPRSSRTSVQSAKSLGKRREVEEDPDDLRSSDDGSRRQRESCKSGDTHGRLFACPYAKYDPTRYSERNEVKTETSYRKCSSKLLRTIPRVKLHLYRVHLRPEFYCEQCAEVFNCQELQEEHSRKVPTCQIRELPFLEKMTMTQRKAVQKRTPGKSPDKAWFRIFRILFPDARMPSSPYTGTGSLEAIQEFLAYFQEHAVGTLSSLVQDNAPMIGPFAEMILKNALEWAVPRLVEQWGKELHLPPLGALQSAENSEAVAETSVTTPAIQESASSLLQEAEAGSSMTSYYETELSAADFGSQQSAEELTGFSEQHYLLQHTKDDRTVFQKS